MCSQIKECATEERGKGYLVSCLVDHHSNISDYQCNQYITKMTSIVFSNYRLICGFIDKCEDDINTLSCGSINTGEKVSSDGSGLSQRLFSFSEPVNPEKCDSTLIKREFRGRLVFNLLSQAKPP